jgi:2-polyprenyl-3-methyl-5-hydroxy-6-metoxy-1,4-benzoquinol methylase
VSSKLYIFISSFLISGARFALCDSRIESMSPLWGQEWYCVRGKFVKLSKLLSRKGLYPFLEQNFGEIPAGAIVLNIGAGGDIGKTLMRHAEQQQFQVVALDIDAKRRPDIVGDICAYDFKGQQFDTIVMAEILEHIHSPHLALENVHRILKDSGRLILTTPFIFPIHDRPYDYYRYTRYGLEYLLRHFHDISIKERNSWTEAIDVLSVRLIMDKNWPARILAPFLVLLAFIKWPISFLIARLVQTDFITSGYVVTARK